MRGGKAAHSADCSEVRFGPASAHSALYSRRESNSDISVMLPEWGGSGCRCWGIRRSGGEAEKTDPVLFRGESERDLADLGVDGSVSDPGGRQYG